MRNVQRTPYRVQLTDAQRETEIQFAHRALVDSPSLTAKRTAWSRLAALVKARSPAAIAHLEAQRGLVRQ